MKTIEVNGTIVSDKDAVFYEWFGIPCTSPAALKKSLAEANGDDVTVTVNSGGGDLFAGNEMHYVLSTYAGNVIADVVGIAASAATVVCCGADKVRMNAGAQYMIHNVSAMAAGDYNEMDKMSGILKNANKATSNVYRAKTGMDSKSLLALMNKETWLDADKAIEYGFVDEIIGKEEQTAKAPDSITLINKAEYCTVLTAEQKAKAKAEMANAETEKAKQKMQVNLLKLTGGYHV